jgi:hypothetical protein
MNMRSQLALIDIDSQAPDCDPATNRVDLTPPRDLPKNCNGAYALTSTIAAPTE